MLSELVTVRLHSHKATTNFQPPGHILNLYDNIIIAEHKCENESLTPARFSLLVHWPSKKKVEMFLGCRKFCISIDRKITTLFNCICIMYRKRVVLYYNIHK